MTWKQAAKGYDVSTNPRWIACHAVLRRRPKAWEFMIWNTEQWHEFAQLHGCNNASEVMLKIGVDEAQASYNRWLKERVS